MILLRFGRCAVPGATRSPTVWAGRALSEWSTSGQTGRVPDSRHDDARDRSASDGLAEDDPARDDGPVGDEPRFRVRRVVRRAPGTAGERVVSRDETDDRAVSRDETDEGWGDPPTRRDRDWYRRERPPHHE